MVQMTFLDDVVYSLLKGEHIGIPTKQLSPLFTLLKGDSHLLSFQRLMPEVKTVLQKVLDKIITTFASRINVKLPIDLYIIYASFQPYTLLG